MAVEDVAGKIVAYDCDPFIAVLPWPLCLLPSGLFAKCGNFFLFRFLAPLVVSFCKVNQEKLEELRDYRRRGAILWCVTARPESCRRATRRLLKDNKVPFVTLHMEKIDKVAFVLAHNVYKYLDTNPKKAFLNPQHVPQSVHVQPGEE
jgi:hypothetical protein